MSITQSTRRRCRTCLNTETAEQIVITSSAAAFKSIARTFETKDHGIAGYIAAKQGVVGLMRYYATILAEKNIRVNSVHPSGVATPMIENEMMNQYIQDHPSFVTAMKNLLPCL